MNRNGKILVAEPNRGLMTSLVILLGKYFEKVSAVNEVGQIASAVGSSSFNVVVIDLDFFQHKSEAVPVVRELRERFRNVEVVLLATFAQVPVAAECVAAGAFDFVPKPWNEHKIIITLNNAVGMRMYKESVADLEARIMELSEELDDYKERERERGLDGPTCLAEGYRAYKMQTRGANVMGVDELGMVIDETLEEIERRVISSVLSRNRGNMSLTAQQLGITRQTLYNKIKKYNLE